MLEIQTGNSDLALKVYKDFTSWVRNRELINYQKGALIDKELVRKALEKVRKKEILKEIQTFVKAAKELNEGDQMMALQRFLHKIAEDSSGGKDFTFLSSALMPEEQTQLYRGLVLLFDSPLFSSRHKELARLLCGAIIALNAQSPEFSPFYKEIFFKVFNVKEGEVLSSLDLILNYRKVINIFKSGEVGKKHSILKRSIKAIALTNALEKMWKERGFPFDERINIHFKRVFQGEAAILLSAHVDLQPIKNHPLASLNVQKELIEQMDKNYQEILAEMVALFSLNNGNKEQIVKRIKLEDVYTDSTSKHQI